MPIYDDVNQQLKEAMKAQDKVGWPACCGNPRGTHRRDEERRGEHDGVRRGRSRCCARLQKQRNDSIEAYEKGAVETIVAEERGELAVIEASPELADDATTTQRVRDAIAATGATSTGRSVRSWARSRKPTRDASTAV